MMECMLMEKNVERVLSPIVMETDILEILLIIKKKEWENISSKMVDSIKENSKMII